MTKPLPSVINGEHLTDSLNDLISEYGLSAVIQATAELMAEKGYVTSSIFSEVAAIEQWLSAQLGDGYRRH